MKNTTCWLLLFSLFFYIVFGNTCYVFAQDKLKIPVAILSLDTKGGISESEAGTLTDRLRSEVVMLGYYDVIERGRMQSILDEQGFSMTGCVSSECAIEAGKLLGVRLMITGNVGKIGSVLAIDIRVIDVTTGKITRAIQEDYKGDVAGLLGLMKTIAARLSGVEQKEKTKISWFWVTTGTIAVAGILAAVILLGNGSGTEDDSTLPDPIWPPSSN